MKPLIDKVSDNRRTLRSYIDNQELSVYSKVFINIWKHCLKDRFNDQVMDEKKIYFKED